MKSDQELVDELKLSRFRGVQSARAELALLARLRELREPCVMLRQLDSLAARVAALEACMEESGD